MWFFPVSPSMHELALLAGQHTVSFDTPIHFAYELRQHPAVKGEGPRERGPSVHEAG
jgi:hypothetical protein